MVVLAGNGSVPWLAGWCGKKRVRAWIHKKNNLDQYFFVSEEKLALSKRCRSLDEIQGG